MPAPANLVHEQSASTGTGNFTTTAVNGKRRLDAAFGTGGTTNVFDYFISHQSAAEWERGTGHMSATGTLVRDTVIESSNANAAVSFAAGTKDVTNDVPALNQGRLDAANTWTGQQSGTTPSFGDNTTKFSTTAFVQAAIAAVLGGVSSAFDTLSEIATALGLKAPLASPTLTGVPVAPTAAVTDNSTQLATTAFVKGAHPYAEVYLAGNTSLTSGVLLVVPFDTEVADSHNWFNSASNYRYTPQLAGRYLVTAGVMVSGTGSTSCNLYIRVNGSVVGQSYRSNASSDDPFAMTKTAIVFLNGSTDYVDAAVNLTAGASLIIAGNSNSVSSISIVYLGP